MLPRGPCRFSQPRMTVTLSLPTTLNGSAAQYQHTANSLLNAETSINNLFDWLKERIMDNIVNDYNVAPGDLQLSLYSIRDINTKLGEMLFVQHC